MNEAIAREILNCELAIWRTKSYLQLAKLIDKSQTIVVAGSDNKAYQVEIQVMWDSKADGDIRVLGAVDDGRLRAFVPLTDSFILSPNGRFIGE